METHDETQVITLYRTLIESWNRRDARAFADLFYAQGNSIGFDGSQMNGPEEIYTELGKIFTHHKTSSYVTLVREVRFLGTDVFLLRASAGMLPPGKTEIKPDVNAIQSLIALREGKVFKIALFQNTPAAFHGRPELSVALTKELQLEADRQQKENSL
jgi:uncharacterized protein (TIGR02246 family)